MPTTRCPIVRAQAGAHGVRGFTTDYHDWSGEAGRCKFCGVSRKDAQTKDETRPRWSDWRGAEAHDAELEFGLIISTRQVRNGLRPYSPSPERWASITRLLESK